MNDHPPAAPPHNGNLAHAPRNSLADFRGYDARGALRDANGNGPVPVPPRPPGMNGNAFSPSMPGAAAFGPAGWDVARSPPNKQNTSHVPCKFYLQGTCQAGKACPFSHEKTYTEMTPCKYFAKGNCKFGAKCLLPHVLPDGRIVNQPHNGMGVAPYNMGRGGPMNQHADQRHQAGIMEMQGHGPPQPQQFPYLGQDDYFAGQMPSKAYGQMSTIANTFTSPSGSNYGSPPNEGRVSMSSSQKGLSVLDAPLPASFDSQGISHFARHGPMASSVPSRFGLDNPLMSTSPSQPISTTSRGFGNLNDLATAEFRRDEKLTGLATSPPPVTSAETLPRRIMMHSDRHLRPGMISSSLPRPIPQGHFSDDEDEYSGFEDDLDQVPSSLHDDVLTPQEKLRRFSKNEEDSSNGARRSLSGFGSPPGSKGASPSRYGVFFASRTKADPERSASGSSPFGHVGSPLRNSSLNPGSSPSFGPISRPRSGDVSPFVSSPPTNSGISGLGMISQQLQRTRLSGSKAIDSQTTESGATSLLGPPRLPLSSATHAARLDRAISSSSIGRERIDEEQFLFSMDDDEEQKEKDRKKQLAYESATSGGVKRWSGGGWNLASPNSSGKSSPKVGPMGTGTTPRASSELKDSVRPDA